METATRREPQPEPVGFALEGRRISYMDRANTKEGGVIVSASITRTKDHGRYGRVPAAYRYTVVWPDLTIWPLPDSALDSPGGWRLEAGGMISKAGCDELHAKALDARVKRIEERRRQADERQVHKHLFEDKLAELRPEWAKACIVAQLCEDESDSQTDYFAHKTSRRILLAWSRHERNNFAEMRKAARRFEPTQDLAAADKTAEHRQNYSMGGGYFLKAGSTHSDGWEIRKRWLGESSSNLFPADLSILEALAEKDKPGLNMREGGIPLPASDELKAKRRAAALKAAATRRRNKAAAAL